MSIEPSFDSRVKRNIATAFFCLLFIAGNMSNAIYPLFVSALNITPRTASANVGQLAAAEFLAYGLVILFAGRFFPRNRLRSAVGICLVMQLLTALATIFVPVGLLIVCRLVFGGASGILAWAAYGYIAQAILPGRLAAIYTACLMSVASLWSFLGSGYVIENYGSASIFMFITFMSVVALVMVPFAPKTLPLAASDARTPGGSMKKISLPPLFALISVGFFSAYTSIFWVYSDPIAQQLTGSLVKYWLTISLVCQIIGALCAALLVERLPVVMTLTIGFGLLVVQIIMMIIGVRGPFFVIWSGIYGFLGYFLIPFFVRGIAAMDETNVMITYIPAAQLLCASLGPMLVSILVKDSDLKGGLGIALAAILITPLFFWVSALMARSALRCKQVAEPSVRLSCELPRQL